MEVTKGGKMMTVSMNVQFTGDVSTPQHQAIISELKGAIEGVFSANGVTATVNAFEQDVTTQNVSFPDGVAQGSSWTSKTVTLGAAFHVNAPAPSTQADSSSTSSTTAAPTDPTAQAGTASPTA